MEILIAGAGIGGLTAALALHAAGYERIRVVEAARALRPAGVGLNILPNAVRELAELGLYDELAADAVATAELAFYNRYGTLIWREPRGTAAGHRWPQFSIHRGHLHRVLADAVLARLGPGSVTTGCRVVGFDYAGDRVRVAMAHADGGATRATVDLLVGADGLRSAVRAALWPNEGPPLWNGLVMWRGTTWGSPFLTGSSMVTAGDDAQRLVLYPIRRAANSGGATLINWVAARPAPNAFDRSADWNRRARAGDAAEHFRDWRFDWLDIPGILSATPEVFEYPMVDRDPLARWTHGRVTLLGDAAHPMYPAGSNGATQAIIDARALAYLLATHGDIDEALAAYDEDRRPATAQIQRSNREMGPESVISKVHRLAPDGFTHIHDVIPERELVLTSAGYARIGGFDPRTSNARPSYSVRRGRKVEIRRAMMGKTAQTATDLYLDLLKRAVTNVIYRDPAIPNPLFEKAEYNHEARATGTDWPSGAHTMVGLARLDNVRRCLEQAIADGVPGDFIETGVWRGGVCIFARGVLRAHGITDRKVWVADSFEGIPVTSEGDHPLDQAFRLHRFNDVLGVDAETVRENFRLYGLLDEQVEFLPGWFRDTLPKAPIRELAVLRLDGDLYMSTMDALVHLYPKLSPGGYVIVDDYLIPACQEAVHEFRRKEGIEDDPLEPIDKWSVFWRRTR